MAIWCVRDCCGVICVAIAYALLAFSNRTVYLYGCWPWAGLGRRLCLLLYEACFFLSVWAHVVCMLSDPGAIPLPGAEGASDGDAGCDDVDDESDLDDIPGVDIQMKSFAAEAVKQCATCRGPKPPRAHHCSTCHRCILKMDHHCPWVNNCVGARNQKHFLLFILYVLLQSMAAVGSLGVTFFSSENVMVDTYPPPRSRAFLARRAPGYDLAGVQLQSSTQADNLTLWQFSQLATVFFVAVVYGCFTCIMLCDQCANIHDDITGIESLKGRASLQDAPSMRRPWKESMQEVMGRGPVWRWLVPTPLEGHRRSR